jgi:hypothetical protein
VRTQKEQSLVDISDFGNELQAAMMQNGKIQGME